MTVTISSPLTLPCGATLKNRIAKGAMTEGLADAQNRATQGHVRLYRRWAEGGAGMLLTGNVQIDRRYLERPGNVAIDGPQSNEAIAALRDYAKAGTANGAHLWMQISHAGRQTPALVNKEPVGPSDKALDMPGAQFGKPRALTGAEIEDVIRRFAFAAGVARVVTAMDDPDPRVSGRGHALLREAGIEVLVGPEGASARCDHLGHILRVTRRRPMVTLKLAQTADGYAAGAAHDPRLHITGAIADSYTHVQRALHDAIMIGSGTAREDDPLMTVRLPGFAAASKLRVVLDRKLALSPRSRLASTARATPLLVITGVDVSESAMRDFTEATGAEVARVETQNGRLDLVAALRLLAERGVTRVFSEGGPRVAESLLAAGFADEVIIHKGMKPLGRPGRPALTPMARDALENGSRYRMIESRMLGADQMTRYARMD